MFDLVVRFWRDERGIFGIDDAIIVGGAAMAGQAGAAGINAASAGATNAMRQHEAAVDRKDRWDFRASQVENLMTQYRENGINPILASGYAGGGGGGGSAPSLSDPRSGDALTGLSSGLSSAFEVKKLKADLEQKDKQNALLAAQKEVADKDVEIKSSTAKEADARARVAEANVPAATQEAVVRRKTAEFDEKAVAHDSFVERVGRDAGIITNALGAFFRGRRGGAAVGRARSDGFADGYERGTRAGTPAD